MESYKEAKKNVIRENVELRSILAGNDIPHNIRDLQQKAKKQWQKWFSCFVETRASKAMFQRIKEEQCLIISGPFGCGKSSSAFHTALKLEETFGFDFMIISNPNDLLTYASKDKKQIFLIDDAFGKYNVSKDGTHWWSAKGESVHQLVTRNTNLRILMTSRLNIYRSLYIPQLKHRFGLFNLISKEVALSYEERQMVGRCYLQEDIIDKLKSEEVVMSYSFFPMLCGTFNISSKENDVEYFTNPVQFIKTEIANFKHSSPDLFYLALAVLVLFDNNVRKDIFINNNHIYDNMLTSLSNEIGYKKYLSKHLLNLSFIALTDSYVLDQDTHFACLDSILFNALAFCIGPRIIQDTYFERNLLDMKTALHNIFIGSQHLEAHFRKSFIKYMKQHLKKEDLKKGSDSTTVLHLVSAEGYADYVEYFLELDKHMVKVLDNTGQTALHKTCIKGHTHVATLLLENGAYIDQSDNDMNTALDIACECGENELVKLLLSRGASIRQKTTDFRSPFHVACAKGNFKVAEILLKHKAEVNQCDYKGYTPLHLACNKGSIEIITMLVTHKANIDMPDSKGETPLLFACSKGHLEVAEILLFNKANVNRFNFLQNTPISIACEKEHIQIIRLLLRYKADVNCKNIALLTPLHVACRKENMDIIVLLIKHSALVNEPDSNFQTPLFIACSKGYHIVMGKIIRNKCTTSNANQNGETHLRVDDNESNEEIVKVLLNAGANVNQCDTNGITPLHLACKAEREDIVKLLINADAVVNRGDRNGTTPLDMARKGGLNHINEILSVLVNSSINVNKSDKNSSPPLHMACKEGREANVKTLLNAGAYVNEVDMDGMTPLHMACIEGNEAIVKMLLNSNGLVKMIDKYGMTPLDVAGQHGHNDIAAMLLNTGANKKGMIAADVNVGVDIDTIDHFKL
ncbi:Hypothetical predicted protein [Mytilus galloprovincialis]|uniref:Novel STAND NTPase 3 domain-containing protein n=1 Tax=Mytilus galloprovincialis TaxID=29158 RepID=A0A8B6BMT5_MYTGA|nr:Hypothetical predicted protein [Mytilus galloprovincialis]